MSFINHFQCLKLDINTGCNNKTAYAHNIKALEVNGRNIMRGHVSNPLHRPKKAKLGHQPNIIEFQTSQVTYDIKTNIIIMLH